MLHPSPMAIELGIDRLLRERSLAGQRVGLLANYASFTSDDVRTVDAVLAAGARSLVIFGPEHGFWGEVQYMEEGATTRYREVPVLSMYGGDSGHNLFPQPADIAALDVLVVDLQDVGARYYTFYASMANGMFVAAAVGTPVVVLDRPNPINGITVEGMRLRTPFISFVGQYPIPNRPPPTPPRPAEALAARRARPPAPSGRPSPGRPPPPPPPCSGPRARGGAGAAWVRDR